MLEVENGNESPVLIATPVARPEIAMDGPCRRTAQGGGSVPPYRLDEGKPLGIKKTMRPPIVNAREDASLHERRTVSTHLSLRLAVRVGIGKRRGAVHVAKGDDAALADLVQCLAGGGALPQEGSCSVARMGNYLSSRPDCGMMSRP